MEFYTRNGTDRTRVERPSRSRTLRAALRYAERGVPVFPCKPGGKKPVIPKCPDARELSRERLASHARNCSRDGHGHHDATTDLSRITAWWNRWPSANIGVPTGERSGILALDVDHPASLEALEAERGKLPATRTHSTGSGGMHYLYRYPAGANIRNSAGKLAEGLDVRAEGGYIVVPPSSTTRPYEVLDALPLGDAPAGLLEALRRTQSTAIENTMGRWQTITAAAAPPADGPIPAGTRDDTLTRIAGSLHDGRTLEELTGNLLEINTRRCEPPLPDDQVEKIARSIHARTPCKRSSTRQATPKVLRELDGLTIAAERREWDPVRNERRTSVGGHTDRDVYIALLRFARRHGEMITAGVRVSVSVRDLAEEAAVGSTRTIVKALDRLRIKHRLIRRDGTGSGPKAGALVLLSNPNAKGNTQPSGGEEQSSVSPCVPPLSAARLRWSAPGNGGRLGKIRGRVIDLLEASGSMTLDQLARALRRRPYDLRTRTLPRLEESGVVECFAGEYRLAADWRTALDRERGSAGEIDAARRQRLDHEREREAFREAWHRGELVSREEMARRRRDRDRIRPEERHPSGTIDELQPVPVPAPELVEALTSYLDRNPRRRDEQPSWLSVALWADDYLPTKASPEDIELARLELRDVAV